MDKLWIDSSLESLMLSNDPDLPYYYDTVEKFGSDAMLMVYVEDDNLFTVSKLEKLNLFVENIESTF